MYQDTISRSLQPVFSVLQSPQQMARIRLSNQEIYRSKSKTRQDIVKDSLKKVDYFTTMVTQYRQLPKDESFARVITALKKLKQLDEAAQLFNLVYRNAPHHLKQHVIKSYSYSAMMEVIRKQYQKATPEQQKTLTQQAQTLWDECQSYGYIDLYILTNILDIYCLQQRFDVGISIFTQYENKVAYDLPIRSKYAQLVISNNNIAAANAVLETMKETYQKLKTTTPKNEGAMKSIYYHLIGYHFKTNNLDQAIGLFRDALEIGLYANNMMQTYSGYSRVLVYASDQLVPKTDNVRNIHDVYLVKQQSDSEYIAHYFNGTQWCTGDNTHLSNIHLDQFKEPNIILDKKVIQEITALCGCTRGDLLKLNFHLSEKYKKTEGGIPLVIAKVAFLYAIRQIQAHQYPMNLPIVCVPGGHSEEHSTLKKELPPYLEDRYQIKIAWNINPRILEFTIPQEDVHKINFIEKIFRHLDEAKEGTDLSSNVSIAISEYRTNLRRTNENSPNKYFSDRPIVPDEFVEETRRLADEAMECYEKQNYKRAKECYSKLIEDKKTHPWPYSQLGWILYREGKYDDAIKKYETAIGLIDSNSASQLLLKSECYRKKGLAYNKKYYRAPTAENFRVISNCYERAIEMSPDNIEAYHNWGILLEKYRRYKEAISKLEQVYHQNGQHDEVCVHLGNCYKKLNIYDKAEQYYQEAIQRAHESGHEKSSAWGYCELGDLYLLQYQQHRDNSLLFNAADQAFTKSIELQPSRDQALKGLAALHSLGKQAEKSKEYKEQGEKILPSKIVLLTKPENEKPSVTPTHTKERLALAIPAVPTSLLASSLTHGIRQQHASPLPLSQPEVPQRQNNRHRGK